MYIFLHSRLRNVYDNSKEEKFRKWTVAKKKKKKKENYIKLYLVQIRRIAGKSKKRETSGKARATPEAETILSSPNTEQQPRRLQPQLASSSSTPLETRNTFLSSLKNGSRPFYF